MNSAQKYERGIYALNDAIHTFFKGGTMNPQYRPEAKATWDKAIAQSTEAEKMSGIKWTREVRAASRRANYDKLMEKYNEL